MSCAGPAPLRMSLADLEKAGVESVRIVPRGELAVQELYAGCCTVSVRLVRRIWMAKLGQQSAR